jgi:predicted PurR-regulated permease PerM
MSLLAYAMSADRTYALVISGADSVRVRYVLPPKQSSLPAAHVLAKDDDMKSKMKPQHHTDSTPGGEAARRPPSSMAVLILVCGLGGALLYFAHAVFIPMALSVLFALLLSAPVEALHRRKLPRGASAALILLIFLGLLGGIINLLWNPAQQWLAAAPRTATIIQRKLGPASQVMQRIDAVSNRAGHLTDGTPSGASAPPKATPAPNESPGMLAETRATLVATVTVVIMTLFLLGGGPPVVARMTAAFASRARASHILEVIEAVRSEVGRYYATIALINVGLGAATCAAMTLLGMPNPILWGALAAVLNFIPYVGSATTLIVLTIVAFVSFDGVGRALAVTGTYLALTTIEGQIVQPLFLGRRLELNPLIVFLALWVGGWFWGIAGIVLAVPSLVALKVVAEHSPQGAPLLDFLSPGRTKRFKPARVAAKASRSTSVVAESQ